MEVIYPRCCGLDVHQRTVVAWLRLQEADGPVHQEVRTFGTMTADLLVLADWLAVHQVTHVAMESTGCRVSWAHSIRAPFIQQGGIVSRADKRLAHDAHDIVTIGVRCRRHLGCRIQLGQQRLNLGTGQLLTALVQPLRAFLKHVVALEDGAQRRDDRWGRGWYQQGCERAVIKSNLRRQGEGLATSHALSGREQDFFLHTDVLEEPGAELAIGNAIDRTSLRHRTLEKPVETGMITSQYTVDSSSHECFLPLDHRGCDAVMGKALSPRRQPTWICLCVQQMGVILCASSRERLCLAYHHTGRRPVRRGGLPARRTRLATAAGACGLRNESSTALLLKISAT